MEMKWKKKSFVCVCSNTQKKSLFMKVSGEEEAEGKKIIMKKFFVNENHEVYGEKAKPCDQNEISLSAFFFSSSSSFIKEHILAGNDVVFIRF